MNIDYLKEFVVLADNGSFSGAAEVLFLSQSSLSKHIKALEQELDVLLFRRTTRCLELTEEGEVFLSYARRISRLQYEYQTALYHSRQKKSSTLTIGSIPVMAQYGITDTILLFHQSNSSFHVNVLEEESTVLKQMLRNGQCELAFIREGQETEPDFVHIPFAADRLAAVCSSASYFEEEKQLLLSALKKEKLLLLNEGTLLYSLCISACEEAGFTPNVSYTSHRIENIIDLVSKNMGTALLMQKQASYYARNSDIRIIPIHPELETHIDLCYLKGHTLSPIARHFVSCVYLSGEQGNHDIPAPARNYTTKV